MIEVSTKEKQDLITLQAFYELLRDKQGHRRALLVKTVKELDERFTHLEQIAAEEERIDRIMRMNAQIEKLTAEDVRKVLSPYIQGKTTIMVKNGDTFNLSQEQLDAVMSRTKEQA